MSGRAARDRGACNRRSRNLGSRSAGWLVLLAWACGPPADLESVRAEIEAVTRTWEASLEAGDPAAAVRSVFTEDALRLPADEAAVRGWTAISAALAGSARLESAEFRIEDLEADRNLAVASGTYAVRGPDGQELTGKFLEVWKRTRDGWRIHRVMWD